MKPEAVIGIMVSDSIFAPAGKELVVTSGVEGRHSRGSAHYQGCAFDLRIALPDERPTTSAARAHVSRQEGTSNAARPLRERRPGRQREQDTSDGTAQAGTETIHPATSVSRIRR